MNQIFVTLSRIKLIKKLRVNFVYVTLFLRGIISDGKITVIYELG